MFDATSEGGSAARWAVLIASALFGCAPGDPGPPCLLRFVDETIRYEGEPDCTFRADSLPGPWIDLGRCELTLLLPAGGTCADLGARAVGEDTGRARCLLDRLDVADRTLGAAPPVGVGWFWDDFTRDAACPDAPPPHAIRFGSAPPPGTLVELSCVDVVAPLEGAQARCSVEVPCAGGLMCDAVRDRCTASCVSDEDCEAAGLRGWRCDLRARSEIDERETSTEPHQFCFNPSC